MVKIVRKKVLNPSVTLLEVEAPLIAKKARAGQFIILRLDEQGERIPLTIADYDREKGAVTIIFQKVGLTTELLGDLNEGDYIHDFVGPLGVPTRNELGEVKRVMVIGGGVGVPPMYGLAKALLAAGKTPVAILGFNTRSEIFYEERFKALGVETAVTTVDGSYGVKGFVTAALPEEYDYFCACGPLPMLKAVSAGTSTSGLLSFEERMGCGFGACMGCSCETKYGSKRICKDGPVLEKEEIIW